MTDLEHALREMLRERATDIRTPPDWLDDLDAATPRRARGHVRDGRIGRALLAAAAIALVVAISLGIAHLVHRHQAPATRPTTIPTQQRSSCPATLPGSWPRTGAVVVPTAEHPLLLAATPDGGAIVDRYDGTTRDVVLARTGSVRVLFTVGHPQIDEAVAAAVDGDWAAITVMRYAWNSKFLPVELDLVNLRTGERRVITRLSAADIRARTHAIVGAGIVGGRVYWAVGSWPPGAVDKVQVYDIATGQVSTDPRSTTPGNQVTSAVQENAYGVTYQTQHGSVTIPRQLPAVVAAALRHAGSLARSTLVTDGSAYAWLQTHGHLAWWQPGQQAVSVYKEPYAAKPDGLLVAGSDLIYGARDGSTVVTDARTGASAQIPRNIIYHASGGGVLWSQVPFDPAVRANPVASLPELRCS